MTLFRDIIAVLLIICGFIYIHELTHAEIYRIYDCESIEIRLFPPHTQAICPDNDSNLAQSVNEVVGYNVMPLLILILFMHMANMNKCENDR